MKTENLTYAELNEMHEDAFSRVNCAHGLEYIDKWEKRLEAVDKLIDDYWDELCGEK